MTIERWLGIDFSGNHAMWGPCVTKSNVWIADVRRRDEQLYLHDLLRVQQLAGDGRPFDRLVELLSAGDYVAAAVDAPFSVPADLVARCGGHKALLKAVGANVPAKRDFLAASEFVALVAGTPPPLSPPKPLRATEEVWKKCGVNARSTMWAGARGGAAMTAACLTLLHRAGRPIWPWTSVGTGLLAEAFPAAQLCSWKLPHQKYDGPDGGTTRKKILDGLSARIQLGGLNDLLAASADAVDAVICAFAALALPDLPSPTSPQSLTEGCIAINPRCLSGASP